MTRPGNRNHDLYHSRRARYPLHLPWSWNWILYRILCGEEIPYFGKSFYLSQTINIAVFIYVSIELSIIKVSLSVFRGGCHGRDRTVVGFTTTYAISAYHHWCCEFESRSGRGVQQDVIKFVSNLRLIGGFLRVLRFPPPIKLTSTI